MKRIYLAALFVVGCFWPARFWTLLSISDRDFGSFWVAGRAIRLGIDPYDLKAFQALGDQLLGHGYYNYTYPPHGLFLFVPLSYLSPVGSFILWNALSALFFWWAARPLIPKGMPSIIALLSPAALINVNYGQTGLLCAGLFLLAFRGKGLAAAALTFKPHVGFLVAPALLRDRRAFLTAVIGTVALVIASALAFRNWGAFIDHASGVQGRMLIEQSVPTWFLIGTTPAIGYGIWGWVIFAAGGAYFLSRNFNVFTAATATFLIAPYGLHYDMAAVCLGFTVMLYSRWDEMRPLEVVAASLAFLSPLLVVYATTWIIPPILLWGLSVQSGRTDGTRLRLEFDKRRRPRLRTEPVVNQ